MSPPLQTFPVSDLPTQAQSVTTNFRSRSRKIQDFDLENCELLELVQYSCTSQQQELKRQILGKPGKGIECRPFVRLFRRCGYGSKTFHVETTAWEGEHMWVAPDGSRPANMGQESWNLNTGTKSKDQRFAQYGSFFWSKIG